MRKKLLSNNEGTSTQPEDTQNSLFFLAFSDKLLYHWRIERHAGLQGIKVKDTFPSNIFENLTRVHLLAISWFLINFRSVSIKVPLIAFFFGTFHGAPVALYWRLSFSRIFRLVPCSGDFEIFTIFYISPCSGYFEFFTMFFSHVFPPILGYKMNLICFTHDSSLINS